jgi:hypothetical protein
MVFTMIFVIAIQGMFFCCERPSRLGDFIWIVVLCGSFVAIPIVGLPPARAKNNRVSTQNPRFSVFHLGRLGEAKEGGGGAGEAGEKLGAPMQLISRLSPASPALHLHFAFKKDSHFAIENEKCRKLKGEG